MTRHPKHPLHLADVVAAMPATRREILAALGLTTMAHDRALGRALQRLRESGRVRYAQVPDKQGGRVVWSVIDCSGYIPAPRRILADVCRCRDAECPDRWTCERWIKRRSGRVQQTTFREVTNG